MKSILIVLLFVSNGFSQLVPQRLSIMNDTEKMMYYSAEKKSPTLGVVFEMLLPTSGYAYSGNINRGLNRFALTLLPVFIGGIIYNSGDLSLLCGYREYECVEKNGEYYKDDESKMFWGNAIAVYGYLIVGIMNWFDVAKNVRGYNERLFNNIFGTSGNSNINTTLYPQNNGLSLQLSYNL